MRHSLPAKFGGSRQCAPTRRAILVVGVLKAFGRCHAAVGVPCTSLCIANLVEREKDAFDEFRTFIQDGLNHIGTGIFKTGQICETFNPEHFVDYELRVADWSFIARHGTSSLNSGQDGGI